MIAKNGEQTQFMDLSVQFPQKQSFAKLIHVPELLSTTIIFVILAQEKIEKGLSQFLTYRPK